MHVVSWEDFCVFDIRLTSEGLLCMVVHGKGVVQALISCQVGDSSLGCIATRILCEDKWKSALHCLLRKAPRCKQAAEALAI